MAERWVECTRADDDLKLYVNMGSVTAIYQERDVTVLCRDLRTIIVNEPPEHFLADAGSTIYQAKTLKPVSTEKAVENAA